MVPSALPQIDLRIGDRRLPEAEALVALRVDQRLGLPSQCEIVLEPRASDTLDFGSPGERIELRLGGRLLFAGELAAREIVHAASSASRVSLRGYDPLVALSRAQHVRAHVGVNPADLLDELGRDISLRVLADERGPVHAHVIQDRQSDLALCADVAARAGLYFFLAEEGLELFPLSRKTPSWRPARKDDVLRLELTRVASIAPHVEARGWHPRSNEVFTAEVSSSSDAALRRVLTRQGADDDAQTKAAARASALRSAAAASVARALCSGDPSLRPGLRVTFPDHQGADAAGYLVCRAIHHLSAASGYVTEVSSEPPVRPEEGAGTSLALGVVTQIDASRLVVKVRLPASSDVETDWMKVVSPGGAERTGLLLLPHVGDVVLVACARGDAGRGLVLGGLLPDKGPDLPVVDEELPFQLRTREGATIELSDAGKTLRIEDTRGSRIVLDPDGIDVLARGDLNLRAPGKTITIGASRIDFRKVEGGE